MSVFSSSLLELRKDALVVLFLLHLEQSLCLTVESDIDLWGLDFLVQRWDGLNGLIVKVESQLLPGLQKRYHSSFLHNHREPILTALVTWKTSKIANNEKQDWGHGSLKVYGHWKAAQRWKGQIFFACGAKKHFTNQTILFVWFFRPFFNGLFLRGLS